GTYGNRRTGRRWRPRGAVFRRRWSAAALLSRRGPCRAGRPRGTGWRLRRSNRRVGGRCLATGGADRQPFEDVTILRVEGLLNGGVLRQHVEATRSAPARAARQDAGEQDEPHPPRALTT